jgi:hypothetical protein
MNDDFNLWQPPLRQDGRANQTRTLKDHPMGLFKPDLYRAFFLGFGITALLMAAQFVPQLA